VSAGTTDYITILAGNYMQPLGMLIERLVAKRREGLQGIKANEHETDWAISSILIAVVMFEGWLMRVRYDLGATAPAETRAPEFYEALRKTYSLPDVTEAFVMRDIVAHNHLWTVTFAWDDCGHQLVDSNLMTGGDKKYKRVVDSITGLTIGHQLHANPKLIDRTDVKKVLQIILAAMQALEREQLLMPQALKTPAWLYPGGKEVSKGTEAFRLSDLVDMI
jgi:hypothetical protein